jgi:hypothetical protein
MRIKFVFVWCVTRNFVYLHIKLAENVGFPWTGVVLICDISNSTSVLYKKQHCHPRGGFWQDVIMLAKWQPVKSYPNLDNAASHREIMIIDLHIYVLSKCMKFHSFKSLQSIVMTILLHGNFDNSTMAKIVGFLGLKTWLFQNTEYKKCKYSAQNVSTVSKSLWFYNRVWDN